MIYYISRDIKNNFFVSLFRSTGFIALEVLNYLVFRSLDNEGDEGYYDGAS